MKKYDARENTRESYNLAIATLRQQLLIRVRIVEALNHRSKQDESTRKRLQTNQR